MRIFDFSVYFNTFAAVGFTTPFVMHGTMGLTMGVFHPCRSKCENNKLRKISKITIFIKNLENCHQTIILAQFSSSSETFTYFTFWKSCFYFFCTAFQKYLKFIWKKSLSKISHGIQKFSHKISKFSFSNKYLGPRNAGQNLPKLPKILLLLCYLFLPG